MITAQVFATPDGGELLASFVRASALTFSTNEHGFSACSLRAALSRESALAAYDWPGTPHLVVSDSGSGVVWEGRVEDVGISDDGLSIGALGYWRAYSDVRYTAVWSDDSVADWRPVLYSELAGHIATRYEVDTNNRLYMALRAGESYGDGTDMCGLTYAVPHSGKRSIKRFEYTYQIRLPTDWQLRIRACADDFSGLTTLRTVTGDGTQQSATVTDSSFNKSRLIMEVINNTGSSYSMTSDTSTYYARLTDIRVMTLDASTITAGDIIEDLVDYIAGINTGQVSENVVNVDAGSTDLASELYLDATPAAIIDDLAARLVLDARVWEGRVLHVNERGAAAGSRTWYVDHTRATFQRSLDPLNNAVYVAYREAAGRVLRTDLATDAASVSRAGLTRYGFASAETTSQSEAETVRDALLADHGGYSIRADVAFDAIEDEAGAVWPLYAIRAGDRVVLRDMWPVSPDLETIADFRVAATSYNHDRNELRVEPDVPVPTLVSLVAGRTDSER